MKYEDYNYRLNNEGNESLFSTASLYIQYLNINILWTFSWLQWQSKRNVRNHRQVSLQNMYTHRNDVHTRCTHKMYTGMLTMK